MKLILILAAILNFTYISANHDFKAYLKDLVNTEVDERLDSKEHRKDSLKENLGKLENIDALDSLPQNKKEEESEDDSDISEEILDKLAKEYGEEEDDEEDDEEESFEHLMNFLENDDDNDELELEDEKNMGDVQSDPAWRRRRRRRRFWGGLKGWWNKIKAKWNNVSQTVKDWLKKHSIPWIKKCCAGKKFVCNIKPVVKAAACLSLKLKNVG